MSRWTPIVAGALFAALLAICAPALSAADKDFEGSTLFFLSTDDFPALKAGVEASQYGAFFREPEVQTSLDLLMQKLRDLWKKAPMPKPSSQPGAAPDNTRERAEAALSLAKEYGKAFLSDSKGRISIAFGMPLGEGGIASPWFLVHFQGGDSFDALNTRFMDLATAEQGNATRTTFELEGISFRGFGIPPEVDGANQIPFKSPEGFFVGRKGADYYLGTSKDVLRAYIASGTGGAAPGAARLGADPIYQRTLAAAGPGQSTVYFNLRPFWAMLPALAKDEDDKEGAKAVSQLGFDSIQCICGTASFGSSGMSQSFIVGFSGRKGLCELLPAGNVPLAPPAFIPRSALTAGQLRLQLDRILDLLASFAGAMEGPEAQQQFHAGLAEAEANLGVKPAELVGSIEGTLGYFELPEDSSQPPQPQMMMIPGLDAPTGFAIRLKDSAPLQRMLDHLMTDPEIQGSLKADEFIGKKLYRMSLFGGDPAMAPPGMPVPAFAIDGDWLILAVKDSVLLEALRSGAAESTERLASDPEYQALAGRTGTSGMMSWCTSAEASAAAIYKLRGVLEMSRAFGATTGSPADAFLDPALLPSSALVRKHFGGSMTTGAFVGEDLVLKAWSPNPRAPAAPATPK